MVDLPNSEISGLVNFRDLGGHPTRRGVTRSGRVFRSDSLAHAAPDDVVHLVEERGVHTVVDLRGSAEVDAFPNQPMADAGVTIHHVPLIDPEKREQSGLDWETMSLFDALPISSSRPRAPSSSRCCRSSPSRRTIPSCSTARRARIAPG